MPRATVDPPAELQLIRPGRAVGIPVRQRFC